MLKDGNAARKKAFECMTLAAKAPSDERREPTSSNGMQLGDARKSNGPI